VKETAMKIKVRTLAVFGIGYLAGSRTGRGPWEKAERAVDQIWAKVAGGEAESGDRTSSGSVSGNGIDSPRPAAPRLTGT
jgi:hypothetical protein